MTGVVSTWDEWGSVYTDLGFWQDEIRAVCESNQIEMQLIEPTFPGTHAVFLVNSEIVLKIYCPVRYNSYRKELGLHKGILARSSLFPKIRFHGTSGCGYDYIAFNRIGGRPIRELGIRRVPEAAIRNLARAVAALQNQTLESTRDGRLRCLVHYDLTDDHVFLDDNGMLEGIIDFGDAKIGHPAEEFPVLFASCLQCDDSLIAVFREAYGCEAGHYRIDEADLVAALRRHTYFEGIVECLRRANSSFARELLQDAGWLGAGCACPSPGLDM